MAHAPLLAAVSTAEAPAPTLYPQLDDMKHAAGRACALLRALGNPDRLMILCLLHRGERSVGELEQELNIQQPTLSQQLTVLRQEALVHTRRDGKRIFYRLAETPAEAIINILYLSYCYKPKQTVETNEELQNDGN